MIDSELRFCDFLQKLFAYYGSGMKIPEFVQSVFDSASDFEDLDLDNPIFSSDGSVESKLYNSNKPIPVKIAQEMLKHVNVKKFNEFLSLDNPDTESLICDSFNFYVPDINVNNYNNKIANLFYQYLENAITKTPILIIKENSFIKNKLAAETNYHCPIENCQKSLVYTKDSKTFLLGKIFILDTKSKEDINNLLLLCPECSEKFQQKINEKDLQYLKNIKSGYLKKDIADLILNDGAIEEGIKRILEKLPEVEPADSVTLTYDPFSIDKKIPRSEKQLIKSVKRDRDDYYDYIKQTSIALSQSNKFDYDSFALQLKQRFCKLKKLGLTHSEIFEQFTDWLMKKTKTSRASCSAVISYHVQQCEIFEETQDATTE